MSRLMIWPLLLWLLGSCTQSGVQMREQLAQLEALNRADSVMHNDSLAEALVKYFDKNGTANERMRAKYILGRTYYDLGEAPKAMESYNNAEESADTADKNCDFATLSKICAQKAGVLRKQYMPQEAATEFDKAIHYSLRVKDTLLAVNFMENKLVTYYQRGLYDSLLANTEKVFQTYWDYGLYEYAANSLSSAINVLIQRRELSQAKNYIDIYRLYTKKEDAHDIRYGALYGYLGNYYLCLVNNDSALFYFRKQLEYEKRLNNRVQAYHGLFRAFQQNNQIDSALKYAELYNIANDSSNVFESADRLQRMQSLYKYERSQKVAALNKRQAEHNRQLMWCAVIIALAILLMVIQYNRRKRSDEQHRLANLNQEYNNIRDSYNKAKQDLNLVKKENTVLIRRKEQEIQNYKKLLLHYEPNLEHQEGILDSNPLLRRIHKYASAGKAADDNDMAEVYAVIDQNFPGFFDKLELLAGKLSRKQKAVCALTKLDFIPSEIGSLLNMRYQSVTNMRSRLAKLLFGEDSTTQDFDRKLHSIL